MPTEREAIRAMLKDNPEVHDRLREMALAGRSRRSPMKTRPATNS